MATPIVEHKLRLLLETKLDEKQKQQVGKQLKGILEGAVIGFDEAETKKNLLPIINTIKQLFDKAEIKFDADKLLQMPSQDALREVANLTAEQFQTAFDRALAKSGGVKIDFGNVDLSAMTAPLQRLTEEVSEIGQKLESTTKKSVSDIENYINRLNKPKKINVKKAIDDSGKDVIADAIEEVNKAEKIAERIETSLTRVNQQKTIKNEKTAINALESARDKYAKSVANDDPWEVQYQYLITFVSKYEAMSKKIKPIIDTNRPEFAQLYELLAPKASGAKLSLEHFVDITKGNELTEYKNQPWARESTLKNIEHILGNGISVKNTGSGGQDEKTVEPPKQNTPQKPQEQIPTNNNQTQINPDANSGKTVNTKKPLTDAQKQNAMINTAIKQTVENIVTGIKNTITNKWDNLNFDEKTRLLTDEVNKNIGFSSSADADSIFEVVQDIKDFADGLMDIKEVIKHIKPLISTISGVDIKDIAKTPKKTTSGIATAMNQYQNEYLKTDRTKETAAFINTKTGKMSELYVGDEHSVSLPAGTKRKMSSDYDMYVHNHNYKTAAPSVEDLEDWFNGLKDITQYGIRAGKELLTFDFSKLDNPKAFLDQYKALNSMVDAKVKSENIQSYSDRQERANVLMRQGLEEMIQKDFKHITMKSIKMSELPSLGYPEPRERTTDLSLADEYKNANQELKELIKQLSVLYKNSDPNVDPGDGVNPEIELEEKIRAIRPDLLKIPSEQWAEFGKQFEAPSGDTVDTSVKSGALSEISAKLDNLATDSNLNIVKDAIISAITTDNDGRANIDTTVLAEAINNIIATNSINDDNKTSSINSQELKTILSSVTYNTRIVQEEGSVDTKVAIDEAMLELTLTKVFGTILNPPTQSGDEEVQQSQLALESTLQSVKSVLDNIQTNTTRIGIVDSQPIDPIAGTTLDSRLTEIKSVLESINQKIADGGKIVTRGGAKQVYKESRQDAATAKQTARSNMMKSLINDYEKMGKLAAQFADDEDLITKAQLQNLKEEIKRKRASLKITMDENQSLREKYNLAFDAEKRLLDAAKAQEKIDEQNKKEEQDKKVDWKKTVKDAQRETGINAADSAYRSANNTVISTIGIEGMSADIEAKAQELDKQNKALNVLRNDIAKLGTEASDEQKKSLSEQIAKVKELKTELDGYIKIHEKYSGENAQKLDVDTSNFGAVGTDQYWKNITAAIKSSQDGKVVIQDLNAKTGELTGTTKIAANTFAQWSATVDPITGELSILRTGIKKTETLFDSMKRKTKEIFTYFGGSRIIFRVFNEFKKGIRYVRDIDLALTELKKVTDETEETYKKFLDTAAQTADKVGSTIQKVVSSTADWARLGYSMKEAAKFAETTQILMNVSEFTDVSQATDTLISAVQAFGYTADTSMEVVDLLNTIGNNYAISTADLAQSLTKSSASLVAAGGDLAEAAALTATANKIIQDADSVGTALKTTSLRLRGTDVSVLEEEGLDSDGAVTSKSKLQSKVKALSGVDILTETGEYKSTYQILSKIADVWGEINDMDQAALLELLAGKRNSSVLAAILQNPEELKAAYEDAMNADGSAIKENEKYLDSIQGKIDQFNNAVQSMWSNTLDSDAVKLFVNLGTVLINIIDSIGLLNTVIAVLAGKKLITWILTTTTGMKTFGESLKHIGAAMIKVKGTSDALIPTIVTQTKALWAGSAGSNAFTLSLKTLKMAFNTLMATPLGWFLAISAAIFAIVKIVDLVNKTTEELREELNGLRSELKGIQSELESVNSELETTNDRMDELLAKDTLSFTEEEELTRLQKQNDELQRQIDLLELEEKYKKQDLSDKFNQTMDSDVNSTGEYAYGKEKRYEAWYDYILPSNWGGSLANWITGSGTEKQFIEDQLDQYDTLQKELIEQENKLIASKGKDKDAKKRKEEIEKEIEEIGSFITKKTAEFNQDAEGLEYGIDPETDKWLDYINNLQDKFAIASGGTDAEINAITRIFNKEEFSNASEEIDKLVEKLKESPGNKTIIEEIRKQCKLAEEDLLAVGLSVDAAVKSFTQFGSDANFETLEGKTAEIAGAYNRLPNLLSGAFSKDFIGPLNNAQQSFANLFDENGNVLSDKIAEFFGGEGGGISAKTQEEIERLVKKIHDGEISVSQALKSFAAYGVVESWQIIEAEVSELNTNIFGDLGDEISGVIDTVKELSSAFESVASSIELVDQAQAEMAYSGHLSVETALKLMESTDDWNEVLEIENGNLKLVKGAEDALVQTKLDLIKTNLQTALSTVEAQLAQITATESSADMAYTIEESTNLAVTELAGNMAYLTEMMNAYALAASGEKVDMAKAMTDAEAARNKVKSDTNYKKNSAERIGREELEKEKARLEAMIKIAETADTPSEFRSNYPSDVVSGGNSDKDSAEDDLFQREMDYWENRIAANQAKYEQLQNEIDLLEKKGQKADASFYKEQEMLEKQRLNLLEQQKKAALDRLSVVEAAEGQGSENWWEIANTLNDIEGELDDVTASIVDLQDAIAEIETYKFEEFNTRLDNLISKLDTIRNLIAPNGEDDWFDDEGNWTEAGVAVLGSQLQSLEMYKQGYQETMDELAKYEPDYESNKSYYEALGIHSEQEWYDKTEQLISQQYDFAESISDTEQSVVDMYESNIDAVEEYTETLIDSYNDYIDSVKEALDAERDLYDFKKNVQKQSKDIATIERRIASLSGSTNASDIAERRKLEAQLYESRESLNETFYDHAKDAQQDALDKEAQAYETAMTNMVDGIRTSLEEATRNMDEFLMGVTSMVMYNADTVLDKYEETNLPLTKELTNPWEEAKKATSSYSGNALDIMNKWTKEGGFFAQFNATGTTNLKSPWSAGTTAATNFKTDVGKVMSGVVSNIETNVKTASGELSKLYQQIKDTETKASNIKVETSGNTSANTTGSNTGSSQSTVPFASVDSKILDKYKLTASQVLALGYGPISLIEFERLLTNFQIKYSAIYKQVANMRDIERSSKKVMYGEYISGPLAVRRYAKGTLGTKRNEWAITDELGPELKMYATPEGNLSFMAVGSTVVPHDLTMELMELPGIVDGLINSPKFDSGLNMVSNAINKPEITIDVENFLKVDRVDKDTLPQLEAMMDKKIDTFAKQLNYSIKKFNR